MMLRLLLVFTFIASNAIASTPSNKPAHAAFVISATGKVTIHRGESFPAVAEFHLFPGDTLVLAAGATVVLHTRGGEQALTGPAVHHVMTLSGSTNPVLKWLNEQLAILWAGIDQPGEARSRGGTDEDVEIADRFERSLDPRVIRIVKPAAARTHPVPHARANNVAISWTKATDADYYVIEIITDTSMDRDQQRVSGKTSWVAELPGGGKYSVQVTAFKDDAATAQSDWCDFKVLSAQDEQTLTEAINGKTDLHAGVILLAVRLYDEAIDRFTRVIESGQNVDDALRWRARVFEVMGLPERALEDIRKIRPE
jgi:hypothetical protein